MNGCVFIHNRQRRVPVNAPCLRAFSQALFQEVLELDDFELAIYLVNSAEMARLNERLLRHQGSTDVITLDYANASAAAARPSRAVRRQGERAAGPDPCGEIFICLEEAVVQARRFHTTWQSELARYLIHGLLHLRGFDDLKPAARRKMKREEDRLLRKMSRRFALSKLAQGRAATAAVSNRKRTNRSSSR